MTQTFSTPPLKSLNGQAITIGVSDVMFPALSRSVDLFFVCVCFFFFLYVDHNSGPSSLRLHQS